MEYYLLIMYDVRVDSRPMYIYSQKMKKNYYVLFFQKKKKNLLRLNVFF